MVVIRQLPGFAINPINLDLSPPSNTPVSPQFGAMWFKRQKTDGAPEHSPGHAAVPKVLQASSVDDEEIPRYPPFMRGLPAASVLRVMGTQQDMVDQLRQTLGLDPRVFDQLVLPVLYRYIAFVHLLPASQTHHHRGAGGLLRHGLEVAFFAARASEGVVFVPFGTPRERHELEPRWHVAVALAGLLHDLGKSVADVGVTDREGKSEWRPYLETLLEWAMDRGVERYFLRWNDRRHKQHEMYNKMVADRVLTPEIIQWLSTLEPEITRTLFETIAGANADSDMYRLVLEADQKSVEADLKANHLPANPSLGVPVEKHILDTMRCLMSNGAWTVNERGARVWVLRDGVHVVWKQAAEEVVASLAKDRIPGIPRNHDTLADILIERGLAKPRVLENGATYRYWPIAPSLLRTKTGEGVTLYTLRLASSQILFSTEPDAVEALTGDELDHRGTKTTSTADSDRTHAPNATGRPVLMDVDKRSEELVTEPRSSKSRTKTKRSEPQAEITSVSQTGSESRAPETATHWFARHGVAGKLLLAMIHDLAVGDARIDETLVLAGSAVLIVYPNGVIRYGDPSSVMAALEEQGWVAIDPMAPLRKVRELGGARGLVLTDEPAQYVRTLLGSSQQERDGGQRSQPQRLGQRKSGPGRLVGSADPKLPTQECTSPEATRHLEAPQRQAGDAIDWPSGTDALVTVLLQAIVQRNPTLGEIRTTSHGHLQVSRREIEAVASRAGVKLARLYMRLKAMPGCRVEGEYLFVRAADAS